MSTSPALRRAATTVCIAGLVLAATATATAPAHAVPPTPISAATARSYLAGTTATAETHGDSYDRDLFPTWITISGTCDTREWILRRDGTGVSTNSGCTATSGTWTSAYDNVVTTNPSTFDIDHLVPLSEAWASGAWAWTTTRRRAFANDVSAPQLIAVSASSNRSKGDKDPAQWLPQASYRCTYARAWVQVKHDYALTVDSTEKSALTTILNAC
nr:HNH endonuclease family protein [Embleya scabrispora]